MSPFFGFPADFLPKSAGNYAKVPKSRPSSYGCHFGPATTPITRRMAGRRTERRIGRGTACATVSRHTGGRRISVFCAATATTHGSEESRTGKQAGATVFARARSAAFATMTI